jgi:hypothetical protein
MPMRDRFFTRRSFAALCAVLWLALPFSPLAEAETMKALTPETVAAHVAARYNDTFGNLYVAWPVDKVVRPLPALDAGKRAVGRANGDCPCFQSRRAGGICADRDFGGVKRSALAQPILRGGAASFRALAMVYWPSGRL